MEKLPNLSVIGGVSEEEKRGVEEEMTQSILRDVRLSFSNEERNDLERHEQRKTPEQIRLFRFVVDELKKIQELCGVQPYDMPLDNILIVSDDLFAKMFPESPKILGKALLEKNVVVLRPDENDLVLASTVFHELFHCQGKLVMEVFKEDKNSEKVGTNLLRSGLRVYSTHKQDTTERRHSHFQGVEEAITLMAEQRFREGLGRFDDRMHDKFYSDRGSRMVQEIASQFKVAPEEVSWFNPEEKTVRWFGYYFQRKVLAYVMEEVSKKFGLTQEEVYQKFVESHFTGHLIGLGKLIEETFGPGSFRRLGDMDMLNNSGTSSIQTLEALQKMRLNKLRADRKNNPDEK